MKRIKISENQLRHLLESELPAFNNGDVKDYVGSEVGVTSNVQNSEGENEYGHPTTADDVQRQLAIQNYWANASNGARLQN